MRALGPRLRTLAAVASMGCALVPGAAADDSILNLVAAQSAVDRLGPDVVSESAAFLVDDATVIHVEITTTLTGLTTSVVGPQGQIVDPATVGSFGGSFTTFSGDPADSFLITPTSPGSHYVYAFPTLGVGTYTVQFSTAPGLAEHVPVISELVTDSPVVATVVPTEPAFPVDFPVVLVAAVFDGATPLAGATVTAAVKPPTGAELPLTLVDDGAGADDAAGDGIYTASFTPTETGAYNALAQITGTSGLGTPFARVSGAGFAVVPSRGSLTGTLTDQGVDDNANGLFDRLVVSAEATVTVAGDFALDVTLRTPGGQTFLGHGVATLATGLQTIMASIGAPDILAAGEDGPYVIEGVELVYVATSGMEPSDWITEGTETTQGYLLTQFERPPIELTGVNSDETVDTDTDGLFDQLVVRAGIRVATPGAYQFAVRLKDPCGAQVQFVSAQQSFPSGANPEALVVTFDGTVIGTHGVDGPYAVTDLLVYGAGGSLVASTVAGTQTYVAAQFEGFTGPPDCDGDGAADLCQMLAGQGPDCNTNFHPDVCDIAEGASTDCDFNVVPDECQGDCNANAVPDPCELVGAFYSIDDGTHEQSIGAGEGDMVWLNQFTVLAGAETIDALSVAWGSAIPDGTPTTLIVYDDPNNDGDPIDAVVLRTIGVTSLNADTDVLTTVPIPPTSVGSVGDSFFVGAYMTYPTGGFPGSQDSGSPSLGRSWIAVGGAGAISFSNLALNPPFVIDLAGFPGNWLLRARAQGSPLDCNTNLVPDDCDIAAGTSSDIDLDGTPDECAAAVSAGAVPDGAGVPGTPLTLSKAPADEITLTWGASCVGGDLDYEVYEGTLGSFASHEPVECTTAGATTHTFAPGLGDRYYLVVPRSISREGSYGHTGSGVERPQGAEACLPQSIGVCGAAGSSTAPSPRRMAPSDGPRLVARPRTP